MPKLTRIKMLGLLPFLFPAMTAAAEQHDTLQKGLPPEKVQQIQTISQTVLTAKHSQSPNPEMVSLRQKVDELYKAVVKLNVKSLMVGKANVLPNGSGKSDTPDKPQQDILKESSERTEAEIAVRQALESVRGQRAIVQQKVKENAGKDHSMELNAVSMVQELENDLDKALQSPLKERTASLHTIKERLAIKRRSLIQADKAKTPSISTIVRHRE